MQEHLQLHFRYLPQPPAQRTCNAVFRMILKPAACCGANTHSATALNGHHSPDSMPAQGMPDNTGTAACIYSSPATSHQASTATCSCTLSAHL